MNTHEFKDLIVGISYLHGISPDALVGALKADAEDRQYIRFAEKVGITDDAATHVMATPGEKTRTTRKRIEAELAAARAAQKELKNPADQKVIREVIKRLEEALAHLDGRKFADDGAYDRWAKFSGIHEETTTVTSIVADEGDEDELFEAWKAWSG